MNSQQISVQELSNLMEQNAAFFLLDVRSPEEHQQYNIGGHLIPLPELMARVSEIPQDQLIVVYCRSGHRSQVALALLQRLGYHAIKNLTGGVLAWSQHQVGLG